MPLCTRRGRDPDSCAAAPALVLAAALVGCGASDARPAVPTAAPASSTSSTPASAGDPVTEDPPETSSAQLPAEEAPEDVAVSTDPGVTALTQAFVARLTVWTRADGTRVLTRRCREGPVDCQTRLAVFATLIHQAAREHGLDPFLLAAVAMRESGLDPAALGRNREAGIIQLHPRGVGRNVRYVQDDAYRGRCQSRVDACQAPVLERGAESLAGSIEECGGLVSGLGAYATGHCTRRRTTYSDRVLEERRRLRSLSRGH